MNDIASTTPKMTDSYLITEGKEKAEEINSSPALTHRINPHVGAPLPTIKAVNVSPYDKC